MTYIYQRSNWPDFFWDNETLVGRLARVRYQQGLLLGKLSVQGFDIKSEATLEILTTEMIKSNEIEGELLDQQQVRSSVAKHLGIAIAGLPIASRRIDGMVEVMLDATQQYQQRLTAERLFAWHQMLFPIGRSGLYEITVGAWRSVESGPMQILSGPHGREQVHYEAPGAQHLDQEMQQFFTWFDVVSTLDPILKAAVAHFWFVTIHPFEDGNGRIARTITDMCLASADGIKERFYSMSYSIEKSRGQYYDILESSQKGSLDITEWLMWFLDCLSDAIISADKVLNRVLYKAELWYKLSQYPINERQRKVLNKLLEGLRSKLTTSKYTKIAKCSQDSALRDLQALMSYGVVAKSTSGGRSTSYHLIDF